MTDYNDPNDPAHRPAGRSGQFGDPVYRNRGMGTGAWIVGIVVAILVIGGIFWGMSGDGQQTATDQASPPAATTGAGSGGSGTSGSATGSGGSSTTTTPANKATPPANKSN